MAWSYQMREHMMRQPIPLSLFREARKDNAYLDFADVGANKAPYYPYSRADGSVNPGAARREQVEHLAAMYDQRANLRARTKPTGLLSTPGPRKPVVLDRRELQRRGATFGNDTPQLQNPVDWMGYGPVDEFNPAGAPEYISAVQMGRSRPGTQPWQ